MAISQYKEIAQTKKWLVYLVGFISFYIIVKFFTSILALTSKYITGVWTEPAAMLLAYLLAVLILPVMFFIIYFKYIKGVQ